MQLNTQRRQNTQLLQISFPRIRQLYKCHFKAKSNKALGFGASPSEKGAVTDSLYIELQYCVKEKHRKRFFFFFAQAWPSKQPRQTGALLGATLQMPGTSTRLRRFYTFYSFIHLTGFSVLITPLFKLSVDLWVQLCHQGPFACAYDSPWGEGPLPHLWEASVCGIHHRSHEGAQPVAASCLPSLQPQWVPMLWFTTLQ